MAATSRTWMKPPIVTELTNPAAHKTKSTNAIVQSMVASWSNGAITSRAKRRFLCDA